GSPDRYLARVHWLADGRLLAELESRDQRRLELVAFDPAVGSGSVVHVEEQEPYLNLHDDFFELGGGEFLWSSERSGFRHLELRSQAGELVRVLTSGDWQVDALEGVDEAAGLAYFSATRDGPTERHLYSVPLAGGRIERLTGERGTHRVRFSPSGTHYVDTHSALDSPPVVRVVSATERRVVLGLPERHDPRLTGLGLVPPELVSFPAPDGTPLLGLLYRAPRPAATPPPLVVQVYGGPAVQRVVDDWSSTTAMRAQALARLGCNVLAVDNRGSARRGLAFESALWRHLGEVEVADQVAGVAWAVAEGLADPRRVGVFGWSYGGYMTLQLLARAPGVFRAGVAGAPVTDWDGYDTHYTERYMGTPAENPAGYAESSVFSHVSSKTGRLLLVHGLLDENVHFRHTARLLDRLIAARREYDLLLFPRERHLPRHLEDRAYMEERAISWLVGELSSERLSAL
ncbi:MAG TPA: prolyl oligopeptidase family serine peptidase, partial [Acidimicrobiales bacterium]|nr:prolyl oligopeptidase family serine peptidase [Acidimicrobiales bacterium]